MFFNPLIALIYTYYKLTEYHFFQIQQSPSKQITLCGKVTSVVCTISKCVHVCVCVYEKRQSYSLDDT